jgi:hypothetical protein
MNLLPSLRLYVETIGRSTQSLQVDLDQVLPTTCLTSRNELIGHMQQEASELLRIATLLCEGVHRI